jgi:hypothetical protein
VAGSCPVPEVSIAERRATALGGHLSLLAFGVALGCLSIWISLGNQVLTLKHTMGRRAVTGLAANTIGGGCIFVAHNTTGGEPMPC